MADKKITQLTAATSVSNTDLLLIVNDPSGSPANKKVEIGDLFGETAQTTVSVLSLGALTSATIAANTIVLDTGTNITLTRGTIINEDGADSDTRIESDNDSDMVYVDASTDRLGIRTSTPSETLDVNSDAVRIRTARTPASNNATTAGWQVGTIAWDANYLYIAVNATTIKRVALSPF